jgi:hypothetical protein
MYAIIIRFYTGKRFFCFKEPGLLNPLVTAHAAS